jgi:hypothetical protein
MFNKKFLVVMAVLLGASLFFIGCSTDSDDDDPVLSGNASLGTAAGQAVVKGVNVVFTGTETGAAFGTAVTGTAVVAANKFADATLTTTFTAVESGSSKAVHVAAASAAAYTEADFNTAAAYANAAIAVEDVFFVKVTSQDGSNVKWYKITVLEDVFGTYALETDEESSITDAASGLTILSATKDASGAVTIWLGGTLAPSYVYTSNNGATQYPATDPAVDFKGNEFWIGTPITATPAAGKYSNAFIHGLFSGLSPSNGKIIAVKQTNQALRFMTSASSGVNTSALLGPKTGNHEEGGATSIQADTSISPIRWRVYQSSYIDSDLTWGFLISDGTLAPKTATFELAEWSGFVNNGTAVSNGYTATITVDYSAVDFGTGEAVANLYSLKTTEGTEAEDDTDSGLEILAATKDTSGITTIKLGGTLATGYVYTTTGGTAYASGSQPEHFPGQTFWLGTGITATPAAGKYSNAYIDGLFSDLATDNGKIIAIKQTNQALRFFTGASTGVNTSALSGPKTGNHEEGGATSILADTSISPIRWRVYEASAINTDEIWGFLIYDGMLVPKTATFELAEWSGFVNNGAAVSNGFTATIIVDYSAVDFGN